MRCTGRLDHGDSFVHDGHSLYGAGPAGASGQLRRARTSARVRGQVLLVMVILSAGGQSRVTVVMREAGDELADGPVVAVLDGVGAGGGHARRTRRSRCGPRGRSCRRCGSSRRGPGVDRGEVAGGEDAQQLAVPLGGQVLDVGGAGGEVAGGVDDPLLTGVRGPRRAAAGSRPSASPAAPGWRWRAAAPAGRGTGRRRRSAGPSRPRWPGAGRWPHRAAGPASAG